MRRRVRGEERKKDGAMLKTPENPTGLGHGPSQVRCGVVWWGESEGAPDSCPAGLGDPTEDLCMCVRQPGVLTCPFPLESGWNLDTFLCPQSTHCPFPQQPLHRVHHAGSLPDEHACVWTEASSNGPFRSTLSWAGMSWPTAQHRSTFALATFCKQA